jgi:hypothetical protein
LQLDDWVLCRIYNKRGTVEKNYGAVDQNMTSFPEIEERKPKIVMSAQNMNMNMNMVASSLKTPAMIMSDQLHMDTSDSVPRLHTDSSCSEHEASPEFTCEREVQSEPKWNNELDNAFNYLEFNYMDGFSDDPFAPQPPQFQMDQLSPLQDMFTYLQN